MSEQSVWGRVRDDIEDIGGTGEWTVSPRWTQGSVPICSGIRCERWDRDRERCRLDYSIRSASEVRRPAVGQMATLLIMARTKKEGT